jgi:NAD dependent epimerase/dehydratase family enzyme
VKTIAISGASGFVGKSLIKFFTDLDYKVTPIKRETLDDKNKLEELLKSSDILIRNNQSKLNKKKLPNNTLKRTKHKKIK